MRIYLVQHGEAESKEVDPERPLTEKGRLDVSEVAHFLGQSGLTVPEIWHGEKARARRTAEIIAQGLGITQLSQKPDLNPLDPVGPVREAILDREEDLMLVGHLPFLSHLANLLLACPTGSGLIGFRPGGVVCLERNQEGNWQVLFVINPALLE